MGLFDSLSSSIGTMFIALLIFIVVITILIIYATSKEGMKAIQRGGQRSYGVYKSK